MIAQVEFGINLANIIFCVELDRVCRTEGRSVISKETLVSGVLFCSDVARSGVVAIIYWRCNFPCLILVSTVCSVCGRGFAYPTHVR